MAEDVTTPNYEGYKTTWEEDDKLERYCHTCIFNDYSSRIYPCRNCLHCDKKLPMSYYKCKYKMEDSKNG